ncbi:hypothetical protein KW786_00105 [Candidatus Parcubacteria bacterium]|nr:hypothetical protein [Candidatus Parcubacteria bacterium]
MGFPAFPDVTMNQQLVGRNVVACQIGRANKDLEDTEYFGSVQEAADAIERSFMDMRAKRLWVGSQRSCHEDLARLFLKLGSPVDGSTKTSTARGRWSPPSSSKTRSPRLKRSRARPDASGRAHFIYNFIF